MMTRISYSGYRFPPEIIQRAIWLYLRFMSLPKTSIQLRPLDWQSPANQGMIVA
jgi:transposase-like protein